MCNHTNKRTETVYGPDNYEEVWIICGDCGTRLG
jgi:hypothetical protein